ncbi:hypothetical protein [Xenorhabdus bovienii]|uniref:hypothetical protein n=1 Tax=Xenorhabdus bovienii TaxID=40576 RepID=UPI0030B8B71F|nr:hypothetical protein [Xenorhabdus bovienii]
MDTRNVGEAESQHQSKDHCEVLRSVSSSMGQGASVIPEGQRSTTGGKYQAQRVCHEV